MKKFRRRSARMNLMHYRVLVRRYFKQIFTSLGTLLPLLLQAPVMLLIVYLVCQREAFTMKTPEFLTGANVILFMLVVMSALMGILNSYREICKEREVLSREVFGGLDISAYVLSKFSVLAAVGLFQCALFRFSIFRRLRPPLRAGRSARPRLPPGRSPLRARTRSAYPAACRTAGYAPAFSKSA